MLRNINDVDRIVVGWSTDRAKELSTIDKRTMDKVLLIDDNSNEVDRSNAIEANFLHKLNEEVLEPCIDQTTTGLLIY